MHRDPWWLKKSLVPDKKKKWQRATVGHVSADVPYNACVQIFLKNHSFRTIKKAYLFGFPKHVALSSKNRKLRAKSHSTAWQTWIFSKRQRYTYGRTHRQIYTNTEISFIQYFTSSYNVRIILHTLQSTPSPPIINTSLERVCTDLCARNRYQGQGQVIIFHSNCGM